jgi:hypothetical protein
MTKAGRTMDVSRRGAGGRLESDPLMLWLPVSVTISVPP